MLCGDLMGSKFKKRGGGVSVYLAVQWKLTQHCKASILQLKFFKRRDLHYKLKHSSLGSV